MQKMKATMSVADAESGNPSNHIDEHKAMRPSFLTPTLWLAFIMRPDARLGRPTHDDDAARDFCCWWLIFGKREYPEVWGVRPSIVEVALESVSFHGAELPRLLAYLWRIHPGVQELFPEFGREQIAQYACWYVLNGHTVLDYAPTLPTKLLGMTNESVYFSNKTVALTRLEAFIFKTDPELSMGVDVTTSTGRGIIGALVRERLHRIQSLRQPLPAAPVEPRPMAEIPRISASTLDLLWSSNYDFGLGQSLSHLIKLLEKEGISYRKTEIEDNFSDIEFENFEDFLIDCSTSSNHKYNLFCMSPLCAAKLWLERGRSIYDDHYRAAYWTWAPMRLPHSWRDVALLFDEIWTPQSGTPMLVAPDLGAQVSAAASYPISPSRSSDVEHDAAKTERPLWARTLPRPTFVAEARVRQLFRA